MNQHLQQRYMAELDAIVDDFHAAQKERHGNLISSSAATRVLARSIAAIDRIAGRSSAYARQAAWHCEGDSYVQFKVEPVIGVCQALRADVAAGWLTSLVELAHAEIFADVLEMAEHLMEAGYKDAAAVLGGAALESHLRQLCTRNSIEITIEGAPRKADGLNSELTKSGVYEKLDQKAVTAWLDLRNKAAHGHYGDYVSDQVRNLLQGVRDFLRRNPA